MRILVKGYYGAKNFGDDALMLACHYLLRQKSQAYEIFYLSKEVPYLYKLLPEVKIFFQKENNFDLFLYGGGTHHFAFPTARLLTAFYYLKKIIKKMIGLSKGFENEADRSFNRTAAIGIGLGPFNKNSSAKKARELFRTMNFIWVRDETSYRICKEWGNDRVYLGTDLCFIPGLLKCDEITLKQSKDKKKSKIGVIVRDWPYSTKGKAYQKPIWEVVRQLRIDGCEVNFISFSPESDKKWIKKLNKNNETILAWNPDRHTMNDFLKALSEFDVFLTARYHGAVFGSLLGKPVICIEIEPKLREATRFVNSEKFLWKYPFNPDQCIVLIKEVLSNYEENLEMIDKNVIEQKTLAVRSRDRLFEFLDGLAATETARGKI